MLKELLEKRFTAKWWSDKPVEKEKLNYVLDCALNVPSKQCSFDYEICVLGDSEKSKEIKDWIFWENSYCIDGTRVKEGPIGNRRYNGQCRAPIVLAFIGKREKVSYKNDVPRIDDNDLCRDIMVSATTAMLAAEEQGLNTGFQGCMGELAIAKKLNKKGFCYILLGMGYIDKFDTETISDKQHFAGRLVYKDDIKHGFDHGNNPAGDLRGPNRKKLPALGVGKRTLVDFI